MIETFTLLLQRSEFECGILHHDFIPLMSELGTRENESELLYLLAIANFFMTLYIQLGAFE